MNLEPSEWTVREETPEEKEINDKIDAWHNNEPGTENVELHEYLGWTWDEYSRWVETGEVSNA